MCLCVIFGWVGGWVGVRACVRVGLNIFFCICIISNILSQSSCYMHISLHSNFFSFFSFFFPPRVLAYVQKAWGDCIQELATTINVSSYEYICVLILLILVYYYACVLILLCVCPHTTDRILSCVLIVPYMWCAEGLGNFFFFLFFSLRSCVVCRGLGPWHSRTCCQGVSCVRERHQSLIYSDHAWTGSRVRSCVVASCKAWSLVALRSEEVAYGIA